MSVPGAPIVDDVVGARPRSNPWTVGLAASGAAVLLLGLVLLFVRMFRTDGGTLAVQQDLFPVVLGVGAVGTGLVLIGGACVLAGMGWYLRDR